MTADLSNRDLALFEDSRTALANAMRTVALEPVARMLDVLPPAGVEGWVPVWTVGVGLAQGAAERWGRAVRTASTCAAAGTDREELAHFGGELATVVKVAFVLVERLANASDA